MHEKQYRGITDVLICDDRGGIDREIRAQKESERMYGKMPGEAKRLIEKISVTIFGE